MTSQNLLLTASNMSHPPQEVGFAEFEAFLQKNLRTALEGRLKTSPISLPPQEIPADAKPFMLNFQDSTIQAPERGLKNFPPRPNQTPKFVAVLCPLLA